MKQTNDILIGPPSMRGRCNYLIFIYLFAINLIDRVGSRGFIMDLSGRGTKWAHMIEDGLAVGFDFVRLGTGGSPF